MSTLKVNNLQVGQDATASNNFTLYQPPTPDGTVRLGVGNSGSVTDAFSIKSNGNVGIGTTNPVDKLDVSAGRIAVSSNTTTPTTGEAFFYKSTTGATVSGYGVSLETGGAGSRTTILYATYDGNVGIGTTNPSSILEIKRDVDNQRVELLKLTNSATSGDPGQSIVFQGYYNSAVISAYQTPTFSLGGNLQLQTYNGSNTLNVGIVLNRDGNVGIGTISPATNLDVFLGTNRYLRSSYDSGDTSAEIHSTESGGYNRPLKLSADSINLSVGSNGAQTTSTALYITSVGNVGIGTNNPGSKLQVTLTSATAYSPTTAATSAISVYNDQNQNSSYASLTFRTSNSNGAASIWNVGGVSSSTNYQGDLFFQCRTSDSAYAERLRITSSGNVGIGTTNPGFKLHVEGSLMSPIHYGRRSYGSYTFDTGYYFSVSDNRSVVYEVIVSGDPNHFGGGNYRATSVYLLAFGAGWTGSIQSAIWNSTRTIYAPGSSSNTSEVTATFVLWDGTTEYTSGTARDGSKQLRIKVSGASTPNSVMIHIKQLHIG